MTSAADMARDDGAEILEAVGREAAELCAQADRLVRALAERAGLDAPQFRCLSVLCRKGPMSARHLASAAGLSEEAARAVVDRLERDGYASRRRDGDGSRVLVHPDRDAHHAHVEPALRDLREAWHPLVRGRCDDLGLVAGLIAEGRRLTSLARVFHNRPDAFTM